MTISHTVVNTEIFKCVRIPRIKTKRSIIFRRHNKHNGINKESEEEN